MKSTALLTLCGALLLSAGCSDPTTPEPDAPPAAPSTALPPGHDRVVITVFRQGNQCLYQVDGQNLDTFTTKANNGNSNRYTLRIIPQGGRAKVHVLPDGAIPGVKNDTLNPLAKSNGVINYNIRSKLPDSTSTTHQVLLWCCGPASGNKSCPDSIAVGDTLNVEALRAGGPVMRVEN